MKNFQAIGDKIFWQFGVFSCNFDSPQVKGKLISSIVDYIYRVASRVASRVSRRVRILGY